MDHKFLKIEDEYFTLKGKLSAGGITSAEFDAAMKELMVEREGRYWIIGANTGKWYVHDGQNWMEANPPEAAPAPDVHTVQAPVARSVPTPIVQTAARDVATENQAQAASLPNYVPGTANVRTAGQRWGRVLLTLGVGMFILPLFDLRLLLLGNNQPGMAFLIGIVGVVLMIRGGGRAS